MKPRLKIVNIDVRDDYRDEQRKIAPLGSELVLQRTASEAEIVHACRDADIVLVESSALPTSAIAQLDSCRAIIQYGVGYDN
jgi:D-3-phosphoglycerate dehydrogenase